jgi:hypothetical protein
MTFLEFLATSAGAGVIAADMLARLQPFVSVGVGRSHTHRFGHRYRSGGGFLLDNVQSEYGVNYILLDGGQQKLELLEALVLVGVYSSHLA